MVLVLICWIIDRFLLVVFMLSFEESWLVMLLGVLVKGLKVKVMLDWLFCCFVKIGLLGVEKIVVGGLSDD